MMKPPPAQPLNAQTISGLCSAFFKGCRRRRYHILYYFLFFFILSNRLKPITQNPFAPIANTVTIETLKRSNNHSIDNLRLTVSHLIISQSASAIFFLERRSRCVGGKLHLLFLFLSDRKFLFFEWHKPKWLILGEYV